MAFALEGRVKVSTAVPFLRMDGSMGTANLGAS